MALSVTIPDVSIHRTWVLPMVFKLPGPQLLMSTFTGPSVKHDPVRCMKFAQRLPHFVCWVRSDKLVPLSRFLLPDPQAWLMESGFAFWSTGMTGGAWSLYYCLAGQKLQYMRVLVGKEKTDKNFLWPKVALGRGYAVLRRPAYGKRLQSLLVFLGTLT